MTDDIYKEGYKYFDNFIWDNKQLKEEHSTAYVYNKAMQYTTEYLIEVHKCSSLQAIVIATEIKNKWLYNKKEIDNIPW